MSGFQITITDVGRAALIDAQNTGTVAFRLSQIGVSTQHVAAGLAGLTELPNERKRLATMAGDVVADDTLHVTIRDEGDDAYALRAFGLYTSTGVLFAVYSQADPILEKSSAAMLLLGVDARLVALGTAQIEFGPVGFTLPPASETVAGVVEIATDAEVDAGLDGWRVVTARTLKRALGALSGFALLDHKHDAADTTSGVFNVGRIPALDMSKITGLANALAGKAAEVHTHAMTQVVGLVEALAGKAAAVHQHAADDIVSGVLAVGRIPALGMEKITGLATALADKAPAVHQHAADDIVSGVLAVGRIPALGMEKITGLANALAGKADLAGAIFSGPLGIARRGANAILSIDGDAGRVRQLIWQTGGIARWILQADETAESGGNVGSDLVLMNRNDAGAYISQSFRIKRETGEFQFGRRPSWAGHTPWDSANLTFATAAEVQAGASASKMLSPANLWSFARSIGLNGYAQVPGTPLLIQWGRQVGTMTEGQKHVMLPVAFGGGCVAMLANPWNSTPTADYYMQITGRFLDRLIFMLNSASGSSGSAQGFDWLAIGLASGTPDPVYGAGGPPGGGGGGGDGQIEV